MLVLGGLVSYGLARSYFGHIASVPYDAKAFDGRLQSGGSLGLFLLAKGFSSGAVALTGVEAISNGVPSFRRPEPKNAAATLVWMGVLLGTLFFGVSVLADRLQPYPSQSRTVIAQLGLAVFGNGALFLILEFATALILVLAANTAYNGFPSLSSIIAQDGYLPRSSPHRGDRLVFSNGIFLLAGAAAVLLVAFGGVTNALIPLYAVGVFTSFTLSQAGMVRHHLRLQEPRWRRSAVLNGVGAVATLLVLLIVAITKFTSGAVGSAPRDPTDRPAVQGHLPSLPARRRRVGRSRRLPAPAAPPHRCRARFGPRSSRAARRARVLPVDCAGSSRRGHDGP